MGGNQRSMLHAHYN